jgi:hypothetical protein
MVIPAFMFGQGISVSSGAYLIANSGYMIVTGNVANSGTLNLQTGSFTMSGNYTNKGTYTQGTAFMVFNGSNQVLTDNSSGTMFTNVFFNGNGGSGNPAVMSSGNFSVSSTGVLNMVNSTSLNANGYLTLNSDATGSARVAAIPLGASITGNVNVQRFITGGAGYRGYRLLSSQVYAATVSLNNVYSINYLINNMFVLGTTGIGGGFDKTGNPTLFLYREDQTPSNASFTSGNFWGISAINNVPAYNYYMNGGSTNYNIPVGNGLMFFFRGSRTTVSPYVATTAPVATTLLTTGTLNTGSITVHNWYTPGVATIGYTGSGPGTNFAVRGFNLVGNPYASSIDWEQFNTTTSTSGIYGVNVANTVYEFNPKTNSYATYQIGGANTNNGQRAIVSGEGFFVLADNTNPVLIFNESAKVATQNTGLNLFMATGADVALVTANIDQHLRLQLALDSVNTDDIYIGFNDEASANYVFNEDAPYKSGAGKVSLASISSDNIALAINKLPLPKLKPTTIPLNVGAGAYGTYKLNMTELKEIPDIFEIWLMDRYSKDSLDMRHNKTYAFDINTDTNSYGNNRFKLVIRQNPALELHLLNFTATKVTEGAQLVWKTENEENYTYFTVEKSTDNGVTFNVLGGFTSYAAGTYGLLDKDPFPIGYTTATDKYRLKMEDINGAISYSETVTLTYSISNKDNTSNNIIVYPNPATGFINVTINPGAVSLTSNLSPLQTLNISPGLSTTNGPLNYGIKIISITGSVIKTGTSSSNDWQANVSNLSPGTYIIQVMNNVDNSLVGKSTFVKL